MSTEKKDAPATERLVVRYIHGSKGQWSGNILWRVRPRPARNGWFPSDHPAAPMSKVFGNVGGNQCGCSEALTKFRSLGYWASCFPEGDGITLDALHDQSKQQVISDIEDVFGWKVIP